MPKPIQQIRVRIIKIVQQTHAEWANQLSQALAINTD